MSQTCFLVFLPLCFSLVLQVLDSRHPEDGGHVSFLPGIQYLGCRPACGQYAVYFIWGNEFRKLKSLYPPSTLLRSPIPHGSVLSSFWFSGNVTPPSYTASLPLFILVPAKGGCSLLVCCLPYPFHPEGLALCWVSSALPSLPFHQLCLAVTRRHVSLSEPSWEAPLVKPFLISFS